MTLREQLREHQVATDCSDERMLNILCSWIDNCGPDLIETNTLMSFVVENLERPPGDMFPDKTPCWQLPMFTDKDREAMVSTWRDKLLDEDPRDWARAELEGLDLIDTIASIFPDDEEALVDVLRYLDPQQEDSFVSGEFLRENDDDDDYPSLLDFAKRMGLIDEQETEITDRGREFMERFS